MSPASRWSSSARTSSDIPELITGLVWASETLSAVSAALWLRAAGRCAPEPVERALSDVLGVLGLDDLLAELEPDDLLALSGMVRERARQAGELSANPLRAPGRSADREAMVASTFGAADLAPVIHRAVVPRLAGLAERLDSPTAALLVVGAGACGLLISFCGLLPQLRATGIDGWSPALVIARERMARAGLGTHVRLRDQDVTELDEREAYDLVWVAADVVGPAALPSAVRRGLLATRPGGWVVLAVHGGEDELAVALARLRTSREGGTPLWPAEAESVLVKAGCRDVRSLPHHLVPAVWMTAGRRAGQSATGK